MGLILQREVSTGLQVVSSLQRLVAEGPNPNDGLKSLQKVSATSPALVIGHNTP